MQLMNDMIKGNFFRRLAPVPLLVLCLLGNMGCEKMLDVNSSRAVGEENMWTSMEDSRAALMGLYGLVRAALVDNNAHWIYGDVRAGGFVSPNRPDLQIGRASCREGVRMSGCGVTWDNTLHSALWHRN